MSRIIRPRVESGEATDASTLNSTYSDFSQSGALDVANTRDQAFDLPHFGNTPIILKTRQDALGNSGMLHSVTTTVARTTSTASLIQHHVQTSAGVATPLNLTADPWTMASGDVMRLWWNLSVSPSRGGAGTPWLAAAAYGKYFVPNGAGQTTISDGLHCWVAFLEWDITNGSLTNWTAVPGQTNFSSVIPTVGSTTGGLLNDTPATTAISAWSVFSVGSATDGESPDAGTYQRQGWFPAYGMWAYPATGAITVYGVRVVLTGIMHPAHLSTAGDENALIYDVGVDAGDLTYEGGRINAVLMRGS